jgi:hypothetical protein
MTSISRSRWAAVGAAVAVSLGAGGIGISHATQDASDGPVSAFFPIEPCRLADTRPNPNTVGTRTSPLGPDETVTFAGWGITGNCSLPTGITGLSLNVTAVDATQQTNLRFFPQGAELPTSANLNPTPGAPPIPNSVQVGLNASNGQFSVFNRMGSVSVVIDVVGYYDDHTHDDRYSPRLFATVTAGGALAGDSAGVIDVAKLGTGTYELTFDRTVASCAAVAGDVVFAKTHDVSADAGFGGPDKVTVVSTDADGNFADTNFTVIVVC